MKFCPICGEMKPLSAFTIDKAFPDGHFKWCRVCKQAKRTWDYSPSPKCEDCRTCKNDGCRHNKRTA